VTSKLQVTIPKRIADRYGIRPGDDLDWREAGEANRVSPGSAPTEPPDVERRLELFDAATARQRRRQEASPPTPPGATPTDRGWRRAELYERAVAG